MDKLAGIALLAAMIATPVAPARSALTGTSTAPSYTAAGLVQAAAEISEPLAPNTLATIYGTNLSFTTMAAGLSNLNAGALPTALEGVSVYVNYLQAPILFVSPAQINFVIPYNIVGTSATLYVIRENVAGPTITVGIAIAAPSFFSWNGNQAIATHADGSLISAASPATAGEVIVLYAAGLGRTSPDPDALTGEITSGTAPLYYASQLQVSLNGVPCPPASVLYAGLAPGFTGLYQINLMLPDPLPQNPTIQVAIGAQAGPNNLQLATFSATQ